MTVQFGWKDRPLYSWTVHFDSNDRSVWLKTVHFRSIVQFKNCLLSPFWTVYFGPDSFLPFWLSSFVPSDHPRFVFWALNFWFPARPHSQTIQFKSFWPSSFILDCPLSVSWIDKFNHHRPYTLTIGRPWDASIQDLTPLVHNTANFRGQKENSLINSLILEIYDHQ